MTHAEQRWIVAKVEQGMALVGALETQLARLPRHRREPPLRPRRRTHHLTPARKSMNTAPTERQSQFLAYIHQYGIINGCAPAELLCAEWA